MDFVRQMGLLAMGTRFRRLGERMQADVSAALESQGVDLPHACGPLITLLCERGSVGVGEAAALLGLTHPAICQFSRSLVRRRLIVSKNDPHDDRRRLLTPTAKARRIYAQLQSHRADVKAAVAELLRDSGADLEECLSRLEAAMDRQSLLHRIQRQSRRRRRDAVEIIDYSPKIGGHFKRLNMEWITKYFGAEDLDRKVLSQPVKYIINPGGAVLFARLGDEIVGTCALQNHGEGVYELSKMAVTESAQGIGIGELLVRAIVERAGHLGCRRLKLESHHSLEQAIRLYRKLGFVHMSPPSIPKYARTDVYMELPLMRPGRKSRES